jgi:hypothetical protein
MKKGGGQPPFDALARTLYEVQIREVWTWEVRCLRIGCVCTVVADQLAHLLAALSSFFFSQCCPRSRKLVAVIPLFW